MGMHRTDEGRATRERLLDYLRQQQAEKGYLPPIAEMGRAMGMARNGVKWHLNILREEGKIDYDQANMSRSMKLKRVRS